MPTPRWSVVLGAAAVALGPEAAPAQRDHYAQLMHDALRRTAAFWEQRGFIATDGPRVGNLLQRERDSLVVTLRPESQYVALAVCDEDCGDLNLVLHDPSGQRLAVDVATHATPSLMASPTAPGAYRLEVVMVRCSAEPCYYGLQLLRRAAVASRPP